MSFYHNFLFTPVEIPKKSHMAGQDEWIVLSHAGVPGK